MNELEHNWTAPPDTRLPWWPVLPHPLAGVGKSLGERGLRAVGKLEQNANTVFRARPREAQQRKAT